MWQEADLAGAIDDLHGCGFTEHFVVIGSRMRGVESGRTFGPEEVVIRAYRRFEGVSDPGDMAIVYAIESRDGTRGILIDAFGVYSSPEVGGFLQDVAVQRGAEPRLDNARRPPIPALRPASPDHALARTRLERADGGSATT